MGYSLNDLLEDIRKFDEDLKTKVKSKGIIKGLEYFEVILDDKERIYFHLGENLIFFINDHPVRVFKSLPFINKKDQVTPFVNECLNIKMKSLRSAPNIKSLAEKYLGKEEKVVKEKNHTLVEYKKFNIIITQDYIFLIGKKTKRVISSLSFGDEKELEDKFKTLQYFVKDITQLDK